MLMLLLLPQQKMDRHKVLHPNWPFLIPKTQTEFTSAKLELGGIETQEAQDPSSFPAVSELDTLLLNEFVRDYRGNWVHS